MSKPILCLDFDGVLHSYTSGWKGADVVPDPPVPGAVDFLMAAVRHFEVHIFSSRSHHGGGVHAMQEAIKQWMFDEGWPMQVAVAMTQGYGVDSVLRFPTEKPAALVTLDDRALTFTGKWPVVGDLLSFKPWNKS